MTASYIDNTDRFTGRAQSYTKYRPGYPKAAIDFVVEKLPIRAGDTIMDMGSGTGILSAILLNDLRESLGITVLGVEPNADMRAEQDISLKPWIEKALFQTVAGTAEGTTLPDQSVDIAVAAAAFHWFDGPSTRPEVKRVVRPRDGKGAPMAIFAAVPEATDVPPEYDDAKAVWTAFRDLRTDLGLDYTVNVHGEKLGDPALNAFFGGRDQWADKVVSSKRKLSWEHLHGMIDSFSTTPKRGTPEHDNLVARLKQLFDKYQVDGEIEMLRQGRVVWGYVK